MQQHMVALEVNSRIGRVSHQQRDPPRLGQRPHAARGRRNPLANGDLAMLADRAAGVDPRQQKQIVHDPRETHRLLLDHLQRVAVLRLIARAPTERDIRLAANDGDGRAEFVRGVGDELALGAEGIADAAEQAVHDLREPAEFIVRVHHLQPIIEIGRGDAGRARGDRVERGEAAAGQGVAGNHRGQEGEGNRQQESVAYGAQQQPVVFERMEHRDQERRLTGILRHRREARDARAPIDTAHANRADGHLALIGNLDGARLHDVAQQRAHFVRQEDGLVDRRTRRSGLAGRHQLRAFIGDEHFEIAHAQFAQHGLLRRAAHLFNIAARIRRRSFGPDRAGNDPRGLAHRGVGALIECAGERDPAGEGKGTEHQREDAGVPEREAHADREAHRAADAGPRAIPHVGATSASM